MLFINPTFCFFGLVGFLAFPLAWRSLLVSFDSSHSLICFCKFFISSSCTSITFKSGSVTDGLVWPLWIDSGVSEELKRDSGETSRYCEIAKIFCVVGWWVPERYLLIVEGVIFVALATSIALQRLSNIAWRNLSAKLDTAFKISWYTIKLRICYNITSITISYFVKLYH